MIDVSIITPTFHRPAGLLGAIASVNRQTHENWQHLIVSDGCFLAERLYNRAPNDPRRRLVMLYHNHNDLGVTPLNEGIRVAVGNWIAVLADDNLWEPEHLERLLAIADANPDATLIYGGAEVRRKDGKNRRYRWHQWPEWTSVDLGEFLYRRDLFQKYGPYVPGDYSYDWQKIEEFLAGGEKWVTEKVCDFVFFSDPAHLKRIRRCEWPGSQKTTEPAAS